MIEALTKKKIRFVVPKKATLEDPKMSQAIQSAYSTRSSLLSAAAGWAQGLAGAQPRNSVPASGGFEYHQSVTHYEAQSTSFQAQAAVTTADGRQINIDLQLNLSREFISSPIWISKLAMNPFKSTRWSSISELAVPHSLSKNMPLILMPTAASIKFLLSVPAAAFWPWISMKTALLMTAANSSGRKAATALTIWLSTIPMAITGSMKMMLFMTNYKSGPKMLLVKMF